MAGYLTGEVNSYIVVPDEKLDTSTNGTTSEWKYIIVKKSRANSDTGAHELGHRLGFGHSWSGIMTSNSNDPRRKDKLPKKISWESY